MQTSHRHRNALLHLDHRLAQQGLPTHLLPEGDEVPYDTLLVGVGDGKEQSWRLELSFLPGLQEELDEVSILQCFAPVVDLSGKPPPPDLRTLILRINPKLPLGSFGVLDSPPIVFWKHNALLHDAQAQTNAQIVEELVMLAGYLLTLFTRALTRVARGELDVAAALQDPHFAHIYR